MRGFRFLLCLLLVALAGCSYVQSPQAPLRSPKYFVGDKVNVQGRQGVIVGILRPGCQLPDVYDVRIATSKLYQNIPEADIVLVHEPDPALKVTTTSGLPDVFAK